MWHATILLHRPFIARWSSNPSSSTSGSTSPHEVCLNAANNICLALDKYFDRLLGLPCDMIFSVFIAASTLLYHLKHGKEDPNTKHRLKLCIHWLSALGKSWKTAGVRHQMLADSKFFLIQFSLIISSILNIHAPWVLHASVIIWAIFILCIILSFKPF